MTTVDVASGAPGGDAREPGHRRPWRVGTWPWSVIAVAAIALVGAAKLLRVIDYTFTSGGDVAFIELGVRDLLQGRSALGPYSRFGWHHPGPLLLELYAPVYWLAGSRSRSLYLATWLLNAGSAIAAVLVLRRAAGELVARVAAASVLLYVYLLGFGPLVNPWNPSVLALPMFLLLVCTAACSTGSIGALAAAAITATYLVQTHIATVPLSLVASAIAVVLFVQRRGWRPQLARRERVVAVIGGVLVIAAWSAPVIQQFASNDGNLSKIASFYLDPPREAGVTSHPLHAAATVVSNGATAFPLRASASVASDHRRLALTAIFAALAIAAALIGWRRHRVLAWLSLLTPIGLLVATLAATRVIGNFEPYLFYWTNSLLLPAAIGVIGLVLVLAPQYVRRWRESMSAMLAMGLLATAAVAALDTVWVRGKTVTSSDSPDAREVAHEIEAYVGGRDRVFALEVQDANLSEGATILALAKDGYRFRMTPQINLYDGSTSRPVDGPTFVLRDAKRALAPVPGTVHLTTTGHLDLAVRS